MAKFNKGDIIINKISHNRYTVLDIEQEYTCSGLPSSYNYLLLEPSGNEAFYGCNFVDENWELLKLN